jgi:hypothetical protein
MTPVEAASLTARRLAVLGISDPRFKRPVDVVKSLLAVQAQDYLGALWSVALRMPKATEADIEKALANRSIVRTWPMRGTLHFLAAADARWVTELCAPRVLARHAKRLKNEYGLEPAPLRQARKVIEKALADGPVARESLYQRLDDAGIDTGAGRGLHVVWHLAQQGVVCFGPRQGKQQTFVLLDDWLPDARRLTKEESLAELARRYFTGHGPATLQDFAWWSGLTTAEAGAALQSVKGRLGGDGEYWMAEGEMTENGATALLPPYDEYVVGYRDRAGVRLEQPQDLGKPTILLRDAIVGTWKRVIAPTQVIVKLAPYEGRFSKTEIAALTRAARRYGVFLELPAALAARSP